MVYLLSEVMFWIHYNHMISFSHSSIENTNGYQDQDADRHHHHHQEDQYDEYMNERIYQETGEINGGVTETDHVVVMDPEHHLGQQVDHQQQQQQKSAEELKQERIQQEVDR